MKYVLSQSYRWLVISEDGLLKSPKDKWGESHLLSRQFETRHEAIKEYTRFVNQELDCPCEMILVEYHTKDINWEE